MSGWVAGAIVATAVVGAYSSNQGRKAQQSANNEARADASRAADLADRANNKMNGKRPNLTAISAANAAASKGTGSTMLTGPQGVDPSTLSLGKTTLLGG